jgi:hypothetical protein
MRPAAPIERGACFAAPTASRLARLRRKIAVNKTS